MANKKLPGGRKSAGRVSTSAEKLFSLKAGAVGVAISELPAAEELTGAERFPVVQGKETRGATVEQVKKLIPAGDAGESAYEIWANAQPEGEDTSEAAYLEFMQGKPGKDGENGADGLSAYQIWVEAQEDGEDTSEAAYLAFQEGKPGKDGENGTDGLSAYQIWVEAQDEGQDTSEASYLAFQEGKQGENGENGASAYDVWVMLQPEGADTTESAYLDFQEGKKGDDGASAYQIWLDAGNEGTEEDFLDWLKVSASVDIDPLASNMAKMNDDGLYVNGAHPVIPKMVSTTLNGMLDTRTSLPDGTVLFTLSSSLTNPLKITQLGGVSLSTQFCFEPAYYYLDNKNAHVPFQIYPTDKKITSSTVALTFTAVMAATPKRAFKLSDNSEVEILEGADVPFRVAIQMLIGTTLSQNGMS